MMASAAAKRAERRPLCGSALRQIGGEIVDRAADSVEGDDEAADDQRGPQQDRRGGDRRHPRSKHSLKAQGGKDHEGRRRGRRRQRQDAAELDGVAPDHMPGAAGD